MEGMSDHTKDINSDISVMKCNLRDLEKELQTKALVSDVSKCVKREHFDVIVNSLGSDLDTKSTLACTNNIQTDIQVKQVQSSSLFIVPSESNYMLCDSCTLLLVPKHLLKLILFIEFVKYSCCSCTTNTSSCAFH
jgi:hypothetical protein